MLKKLLVQIFLGQLKKKIVPVLIGGYPHSVETITRDLAGWTAFACLNVNPGRNKSIEIDHRKANRLIDTT